MEIECIEGDPAVGVDDCTRPCTHDIVVDRDVTAGVERPKGKRARVGQGHTPKAITSIGQSADGIAGIGKECRTTAVQQQLTGRDRLSLVDRAAIANEDQSAAAGIHGFVDCERPRICRLQHQRVPSRHRNHAICNGAVRQQAQFATERGQCRR